MAKAYLGLGSNMGNTKQNLQSAIDSLESFEGVTILKKSSYYETEPVGYDDQDWFLNLVIELETTLEPKELLVLCQTVEELLKRKRIIRWGPRTIDVDILLYENYRSNEEILTVPHPRMTERAFVMIPLYEIAPNLMIGDSPIDELLKDVEGKDKVIKIV